MKENGIIKSDDEEIYSYGLEILQSKLTAGILAIILSFFLKTQVFLCILLMVLIPIRKYAGGVHAKSKWVCLIVTEIILVFAELAYKCNLFNVILSTIVVIIGATTVIIKSPYESVNHPLMEKQRKKYRMISCLFCFIYLVGYMISYINNIYILKAGISYAFLIEFLLLIIPSRVNN